MTKDKFEEINEEFVCQLHNYKEKVTKKFNSKMDRPLNCHFYEILDKDRNFTRFLENRNMLILQLQKEMASQCFLNDKK